MQKLLQANEASELTNAVNVLLARGWTVVPGTQFHAIERHHDNSGNKYFANKYFIVVREPVKPEDGIWP